MDNIWGNSELYDSSGFGLWGYFKIAKIFQLISTIYYCLFS